MPASHATIPTASASRYLQQLCKHWSHKFAVEFTPEHGTIPFDETRVLHARCVAGAPRAAHRGGRRRDAGAHAGRGDRSPQALRVRARSWWRDVRCGDGDLTEQPARIRPVLRAQRDARGLPSVAMRGGCERCRRIRCPAITRLRRHARGSPARRATRSRDLQARSVEDAARIRGRQLLQPRRHLLVLALELHAGADRHRLEQRGEIAARDTSPDRA